MLTSVRLDEKSSAACALTSWRDWIQLNLACAPDGLTFTAPVLAWAGRDRRINLLTLSESRATAPIRLAQAKSGVAPAVCRHRDALVLAWTGTDRRINVLTVAENRVTATIRLDEARTGFAPAVCGHRGRLTLAWTGTDAHLDVAHLPVT